MCYENLWGPITYYSYNWDANDAMVSCRQLGLPWECEFKSYVHDERNYEDFP